MKKKESLKDDRRQKNIKNHAQVVDLKGFIEMDIEPKESQITQKGIE
jgi:hypothetical protein